MIAQKTLLRLGRAFPQAIVEAAEDGSVSVMLPNGKVFRCIGPFDNDYGWRLMRRQIKIMEASKS